jgi:DNA-binding NarL/FixJ family response regulator
MNSSNPVDVVVTGAGYAGVTVTNRILASLTDAERSRVRLTVVNPRPDFVERIRPHELAAGMRQSVTVPLTDHGLHALARRCRDLLGQPHPARWARYGITAREADVLELVVAGLANKQIATRLRLSPRTVEKHVESLLRKTAARSRIQLCRPACGESRRRHRDRGRPRRCGHRVAGARRLVGR